MIRSGFGDFKLVFGAETWHMEGVHMPLVLHGVFFRRILVRYNAPAVRNDGTMTHSRWSSLRTCALPITSRSVH